MRKYGKYWLFMLGIMLTGAAYADIVINMQFTEAGTAAGTVDAKQTPYGVLFTPDLHGLAPGVHGFHVHESPSCGNAGMAAGGHLDPKHTGKHLGPYNNAGHLGDLPVLIVDKDGNATLPILAPRLKLSQLKGHSLMIHEGGDNYSDTPVSLGGGGARIACGIIQ